jgi:hypothetical protein
LHVHPGPEALKIRKLHLSCSFKAAIGPFLQTAMQQEFLLIEVMVETKLTTQLNLEKLWQAQLLVGYSRCATAAMMRRKTSGTDGSSAYAIAFRGIRDDCESTTMRTSLRMHSLIFSPLYAKVSSVLCETVRKSGNC